MKPISLPLPESYWVEPNRFLAGEYPGGYNDEFTRRRIDALIQTGINTFMDLTEPNENIPYTNILHEQAKIWEVNVHYHNFPIPDFRLPTPDQMKSILDAIDEALQKGQNIYLHCWGGIGRTGTTVGCYLVRHGKTGEEALRQLATWWKTVPKSVWHKRTPETPEQIEFILQWARSRV
ncbi:MAG TPA: dual specificity protein phosphatase family protein [Anaerolineales bacterium]|nr:dual specificity protein phosphatase family protein [Anaerolineales bacterium]